MGQERGQMLGYHSRRVDNTSQKRIFEGGRADIFHFFTIKRRFLQFWYKIYEYF